MRDTKRDNAERGYVYLRSALAQHPKPNAFLCVKNHITYEAAIISIPNDEVQLEIEDVLVILDRIKLAGYYAEYLNNVATTAICFLICWDARIVAEEFGLDLDSCEALRDPCSICATQRRRRECPGCRKKDIFNAYYADSEVTIPHIDRG